MNELKEVGYDFEGSCLGNTKIKNCKISFNDLKIINF